MFANDPLQEFVVAIRVAVDIALEIGIGLDYIGIISNWQSYFCRTSISLNEVSVLEIMDIPAICVRHNVFSSGTDRNCMTLGKKNYRSKISLRDQSHFARSKQFQFPRYVRELHCVARWMFLFPPLAELRIFLAIISSRADKFLGMSKPFDVYLRWRPGFQDACIVYSHARHYYEILRRGTSRHKALLNAPPTIYARAQPSFLSQSCKIVAFIYLERSFLARRCLKWYSTLDKFEVLLWNIS